MTEASAHSDAEKACVRCNAEEDVLISLDCGHSFCLICMSYIVIKCRANGNSESQVVCPAMGCNKVLSGERRRAASLTNGRWRPSEPQSSKHCCPG